MSWNRRNNILILASLTLIISAGIYLTWPRTPAHLRLVVSTTTSLYDTGVLDEIEGTFEAEYPIDIYFISVGTGLAIQHARRGDADMILVHAPAREFSFLEEGYGVNRKIVAYNYFSIIGPAEDPASIRYLPPTQALEAIVEGGERGEALWVSRGDDSGTHSKENELWAAAGFDPSILRDEGWYRESGTGMGKTLQITEEFGAYTLTDMGTYLKYSEEGLIDLIVLVGAGRELINVYSAIAVNPEVSPDANFEGAMTFIGFLISEEGQGIFADYGVEDYGVNLFNPAVSLLESRFDPEIAGWIEAAAFHEGSECHESFRVDAG
ncbi:MAG: substrate-binding domain-containing protein, partial [Candidatus Bathyarchaeota archaeon]